MLWGKAKVCIAGFGYNAVYILYHRALKVLEDHFGKPNYTTMCVLFLLALADVHDLMLRKTKED